LTGYQFLIAVKLIPKVSAKATPFAGGILSSRETTHKEPAVASRPGDSITMSHFYY
jgi:hypothetical protein